MCSIIVLMSSVLIYNVENDKIYIYIYKKNLECICFKLAFIPSTIYSHFKQDNI